jgi:general secretion pathway protein B
VSLILDALRKAEAERKLGRAPTLATVSPWRVQRRMPLYAVVLIILLGAVAVLAGVLWFAPRQAEPPVAQAPAARRAANEPAARAKPAPATTTKPAPAATPTRDPVRAAPERAAAKPAPAPARPVPPSERLPTVVPSGPPVPHLEPETAPARPVPAEPTPAAPAAPRNVLPQLPQPAPAAPSPAPREVPATPATLPSNVGPMSAAARSALGEIKLTLHYYNADPTRRFVILDGERYGEGQATGKGLKVTEIRPDGLIGEFQGEFFYLPRGGG